MTTGTDLILKERERQIKEEGWSAEHDKQWGNKELLRAALCYLALELVPHTALMARIFKLWPWDRQWWKPSASTHRNYVKAGALIAAELDRVYGA